MIRRTLCISVGPVTPAAWPACERLFAALRPLGRVPVTLLVVPCHVREGPAAPAPYRRALEACIAAGHELALHGCP